jgi:hypothetical protein
MRSAFRKAVMRPKQIFRVKTGVLIILMRKTVWAKDPDRKG